MQPEYYQNIARTLERAKFHLAFFDDRLAMPDIYGGDHRATVEHGIRAVKLDVVPIMMAMGLATTRLGLGATYSTTYYEPYHVARVFATLDLLLGGRAAWNVVTSVNDSEAMNFGYEEHLDHDLRYERAHEFMEVVSGHWRAWDDDALVLDRVKGRFADPDKVHRLNHVGRYFKSRGPFTVPRSAQGQPVVMQAGQSGAGRKFAAKWGELIFASFRNLESAKALYKSIKDEVERAGRNPDHVKVAPAIYVVVGETRDIAKEKLDVIKNQSRAEDGLTLMAESLNFDFSVFARDHVFTDEELAQIGPNLGTRDGVIKASGKSNPTLDDFIKFSGRGTVAELPMFDGSPGDVADQLEEWFVEGGCDGFVLSATHRPGAYEDFARLVVPELQRRGMFHHDYSGATLRENLGLPSLAQSKN